MSEALRLILWPFHNGLPDVSMGAGPSELAGDGALRSELESIGWRVSLEAVEPADPARPEIARTFELLRRLADRVGDALRANDFPLVLAGGCNSSIGTMAGMREVARRPALVWFDAHADFDRTEENVSGFLDVMGLSMLTGGSWQALCATVPGFAPVDEREALLAGARDLEPYQREAVERSRLRRALGRIEPSEFGDELDDVSASTDGLYVHLDLDVVDSAEIVANEYAAADGPSVERIEECLDSVFAAGPVRAAALTAWDPAHDRDGGAREAARRLVARMARRAFERRAG
jgi:arginase